MLVPEAMTITALTRHGMQVKYSIKTVHPGSWLFYIYINNQGNDLVSNNFSQTTHFHILHLRSLSVFTHGFGCVIWVTWCIILGPVTPAVQALGWSTLSP